MVKLLNNIFGVVNRLFDAIAIAIEKHEQAKTEARRKKVQDDPVDAFTEMFGPADSRVVIDRVRDSQPQQSMRANTATTELDENK